MQIGYLEIVTSEVEAVCGTYERAYGVDFGEPVAALGNARTAVLPEGGMLGIRAPLRATEAPVVRPYFLVEDVAAAVEVARTEGAEIAVPAMQLPGQGTCAIYIQGGIEHGIWQNE